MAKKQQAKVAFAVASRRGKRSRRKGKVYEREVASGYREIYGAAVKRGWQAREGHDAPDVENVPGLWVEAKHHGQVSARAALAQAIDAAKKAGSKAVPVAHCKDDGLPAVVVLRQEDWWELLRRREELVSKNVGLVKEVNLLTKENRSYDTAETAGAKAKLAAGAALAFAEAFAPAQPPRNGVH